MRASITVALLAGVAVGQTEFEPKEQQTMQTHKESRCKPVESVICCVRTLAYVV